MSYNIDPNNLKKWLNKNNWIFIKKNKHETWMYSGGEIDRILKIGMHRSKGQGISDEALKDIAKIMEISIEDLIKAIREKRKI